MAEIDALRAAIDDLDRKLAALVAERRAVSAEIQRLRLASGGGPVDPARELAVITAYSVALGPAGDTLAHAVLDACRPRLS